METEEGTSNGDNTECSEAVHRAKIEALTNGAAHSNDVVKRIRRFNCEAVSNGVVITDRNGVALGNSSAVESYRRTYKRRKQGKSNSESKSGEGCHNESQSLGDDKGGIEECMKRALMHHPKTSCSTTSKETCEIGKVGQDYSPHFELMSHRLQKEVNGHANALCNGSCNVSDGPDANELCQRALCNVLVSEKFSSLCKVLLENFKGMKPETVFDFSVINSRLKEHAYEQSPTLFLSDIHQVWRKLQDAGNEIVSLAKGLSNMSRISCEQEILEYFQKFTTSSSKDLQLLFIH